MALGSAGFALSGYLAEALTLSPIVTQGPNYPLARNMPLDKDNDLVHLNDNLTNAAGIITYLSGRVLDSSGTPIRGALVELWHADREGDYLYSASAARNPACDANFAGFGQFLTGSSGQYLFRIRRLAQVPQQPLVPTDRQRVDGTYHQALRRIVGGRPVVGSEIIGIHRETCISCDTRRC